LDFSVFDLSCNTFWIKADDKLVMQLIAHITRIDKANLTRKAKRAIKVLDEWKNEFCSYRKDVKEI